MWLVFPILVEWANNVPSQSQASQSVSNVSRHSFSTNFSIGNPSSFWNIVLYIFVFFFFWNTLLRLIVYFLVDESLLSSCLAPVPHFKYFLPLSQFASLLLLFSDWHWWAQIQYHCCFVFLFKSFISSGTFVRLAALLKHLLAQLLCFFCICPFFSIFVSLTN